MRDPGGVFGEQAAELRQKLAEHGTYKEQYKNLPPDPTSYAAMFGVLLAVAAGIVTVAVLFIAKPWDLKREPPVNPYNAFNLPDGTDVTAGPVRQAQVTFGSQLSLDHNGGPAVVVSRTGVKVTGATATMIPDIGRDKPEAVQYQRCRSVVDPDLSITAYTWSQYIPPVPQCVLWSGPDKTRHLTLVVLTKVGTTNADFTIRDWHWGG